AMAIQPDEHERYVESLKADIRHTQELLKDHPEATSNLKAHQIQTQWAERVYGKDLEIKASDADTDFNVQRLLANTLIARLEDAEPTDHRDTAFATKYLIAHSPFNEAMTQIVSHTIHETSAAKRLAGMSDAAEDVFIRL